MEVALAAAVEVADEAAGAGAGAGAGAAKAVAAKRAKMVVKYILFVFVVEESDWLGTNLQAGWMRKVEKKRITRLRVFKRIVGAVTQ